VRIKILNNLLNLDIHNAAMAQPEFFKKRLRNRWNLSTFKLIERISTLVRAEEHKNTA
jgi:hypothetical protein